MSSSLSKTITFSLLFTLFLNCVLGSPHFISTITPESLYPVHAKIPPAINPDYSSYNYKTQNPSLLLSTCWVLIKLIAAFKGFPNFFQGCNFLVAYQCNSGLNSHDLVSCVMNTEPHS